MSELTGAEVRLEQHPHDGWVVVFAWSVVGDPGRRAAMPATTARRLADELRRKAIAADLRNGTETADELDTTLEELAEWLDLISGSGDGDTARFVQAIDIARERLA